jgi:hypothetical protein
VASPSDATVLHFMGPFLMQWWTHGMAHVKGFFNLLMIVTAFSESYQAGSILFVAATQLAGSSFVYARASSLSMGAAFLVRKHVGIDGATLATIVTAR